MKKILFTPILHKSPALLLFIAVSLAAAPAADTVVRRAALDIGSGQIKMQVADIDVRTNRIVNVLLNASAYVGLREHLSRSVDERFSVDIQCKTVKVIKRLVKKAAPFHPKAFHAIATEPLRLAKNGPELAERIAHEAHVPVTIVSQVEEGILGFISAVNEVEVDVDRVVVWDFGGGSFQITAKSEGQYKVYQGRLGKTPMKNALLRIQGKDIQPLMSPNPISKAEARQALQFVKENIKDIPAWLDQKLNHSDVVILGVGINPLWRMQSRTHYSRQHVFQALEDRLNLDDEALQLKEGIPAKRREAFLHVVSNLILAYGVMETLGISQVHYVGTPGANAVGTLLSPHYWEND